MDLTTFDSAIKCSFINRDNIDRVINLRDLLENLFGCSSPVARDAFSSETSLCLFAEANVTPFGDRSFNLFACALTSSTIQIFCYKSDIISSRWHPWWELDFDISLLEGGSAVSKAFLQAPPPFPLPRLPLGSLRSPMFFSFFHQCGAWSQVKWC